MKFYRNTIQHFSSIGFINAICIVSVLLISIQVFASGYYNNYLIFSRPFHILEARESLYAFHQDLYGDIFKYSPFFAFAMGIFTYLPDEIGIILWNMLGIVVLLEGMQCYFTTFWKMRIALLILFPFILLSAYNLQSNTLIAGCILTSLYFLEKQKIAAAALLLAMCFFIKGYGAFAALLFIFFNKKEWFIGWLMFWAVLFLAVPFIFFPFNYMLLCYREWIHILLTVHLNLQCSVGGFFRQCFNIDIPDEIWGMSGFAIFLLPLLNVSLYKSEYFRQMLSASLLIFIVIFNKMAEIPTFLIASVGICIWTTVQEKRNWFDKMIIGSAIIISIISLPFFPRIIMDRVLIPYSIIVIPFLFAWLKIQYQLWKMEFANIRFANFLHS